jgi:3-hydroxyacyl-CoA dehydrogenase
MSLPTIKNVAVIGGGTMGSGIAAHLANLGFSVSLISLTREEAIAGLERARHASPPGFMSSQTFQSVTPGGIETHLELIAEADWVCEAIVEKLGPKRALYAQLEEVAGKATYITTNTSGLPLSDLAEGRSDHFRARFSGTHFFNPPRYLKLLELIPGPGTDDSHLSTLTEFLELKVARRVVLAKDTPGFIANRFGMYVLFQAIHMAEQLQFTAEQTDAVTGLFMGRPRSGTFRLADIIGLDVMRDIALNLIERCPDEATHTALTAPKSFAKLLEKEWIGDKVGQGYFRREARDVFTLDLMTHAYRLRQEPEWDSLTRLAQLDLIPRLQQALSQRDEVGEFVSGHLRPILRYAESIRAEVSHTALDFDRVMEWGFGWQMGPFKLAEALGSSISEQRLHYYVGGAEMENVQPERKTLSSSDELVDIPKEPQYVRLADFPVVEQKETVTVRDLDDGLLSLCLKTKHGVISPQVVRDLSDLLKAEPDARFVLTSEAKSFSVGYDLNFFLSQIEAKAFEEIDAELAKLHRLGEMLERRKVVAAVFGHTLGAGLELAMSCPLIVADSEAKMGLPEAKVGLIPGGRGTVLSRMNSSGTAKELSEAALMLLMGVTSKSAPEAQQLNFLRKTDVVSFHPDRLAAEAIRLARTVSVSHRHDWHTPEGPVTGMIDRAFAEAHKSPDWSPYDATVGEKIKNVFSKSTSYEDALLRERSEFMDLASKSLTQARIRHMLETGKPLRN